MPTPEEHVIDAQSMSLDAEIVFYELFPVLGGVIRFKNDNDQEWMGELYKGIPLELSGEGRNSEQGMTQPSLTIGQPDIDLSAFKPLIANGGLDGARIDKHVVLLEHVLNDSNIKRTTTFRIKRVEKYSSTVISLVLATFSPAGPSNLPFRQFIPPAFPFVRLS